MNPLRDLYSYGQSFWYDNIRRSLLLDGTWRTTKKGRSLRRCACLPRLAGRMS